LKQDFGASEGLAGDGDDLAIWQHVLLLLLVIQLS
jgi:hypothetical protein